MLAGFASQLWNGLFTAVAFLFVLSMVVVIHELGHFLVARWCGVKVDAFAMGFGREVVGWNDSKGTRWRLNWIPLGGYVKFMDDANGASVPDAEIIAKMTPEERTTSFHAKPLWQRAAVIFAGPFANFLLAVVLLGGMAMVYGVRTAPARVEIVVPGSPADRAGLRSGDLITQLNDTKINSFSELIEMVAENPGRTFELVYNRDGKLATTQITPSTTERQAIGRKFEVGEIGLTFPARVESVIAGRPAALAGLLQGDIIRDIDGKRVVDFTQLRQIVSGNAGRELQLTYERNQKATTVKVTPYVDEESDGHGGKVKVGRLGLNGSSGPVDVTVRRAGPIEALVVGVTGSTSFLAKNIIGLGQMIKTGKKLDQLGSVGTIAAVSGQAARIGFDALLGVAVAISLSVGFMNLLPIPPLDGGHLMFYAAEAVRGRPLSDATKYVFLRIGVTMIATLFLFLIWNDRLSFRYLLGG